MAAAETLSFFRAWLSDPFRVAAVAPSGRALAELITSEIDATTGPVLELGAGTGAFTRLLIERGVAEEELTLVEAGSDFARVLEHRFPGADVIWSDAARLSAIPRLRRVRFGAIVSGLPILTMPPRKAIAILAGAFDATVSSGAFYQFTYMPGCPIPRAILDRLGLKAIRIGRTLRNAPPAAVYRITRRAAAPKSCGRLRANNLAAAIPA